MSPWQVLASANALFLKIRASLQRCVKLVSRGQTLAGLAHAFQVGTVAHGLTWLAMNGSTCAMVVVASSAEACLSLRACQSLLPSPRHTWKPINACGLSHSSITRSCHIMQVLTVSFMHVSFNAVQRVLSSYANELIKRLPKTAAGATSVPGPYAVGGDWHIRLSEEEEAVVCHILHTAEYCRCGRGWHGYHQGLLDTIS